MKFTIQFKTRSKEHARCSSADVSGFQHDLRVAQAEECARSKGRRKPKRWQPAIDMRLQPPVPRIEHRHEGVKLKRCKLFGQARLPSCGQLRSAVSGELVNSVEDLVKFNSICILSIVIETAINLAQSEMYISIYASGFQPC